MSTRTKITKAQLLPMALQHCYNLALALHELDDTDQQMAATASIEPQARLSPRVRLVFSSYREMYEQLERLLKLFLDYLRIAFDPASHKSIVELVSAHLGEDPTFLKELLKQRHASIYHESFESLAPKPMRPAKPGKYTLIKELPADYASKMVRETHTTLSYVLDLATRLVLFFVFCLCLHSTCWLSVVVIAVSFPVSFVKENRTPFDARARSSPPLSLIHI